MENVFQHISIFNSYLFAVGDGDLIPIPVVQNGNCLPIALFSTITNSGRRDDCRVQGAALRRQAAAHILSRIDKHQGHLFSAAVGKDKNDKTVSAFVGDSIKLLVQDKRWMDVEDLLPLIDFWGVQLVIVHPEASSNAWMKSVYGDERCKVQYVLIYNGTNHYSATSEF